MTGIDDLTLSLPAGTFASRKNGERRMGEAATDELDHATLRGANLPALRAAIRAGRYRRHTAGLAEGRLQANLAIMPEAHALDFMRFCQRNPKPCPLVGVTDTGNPRLATLGRDLDIRTDAPAYAVYEDGERVDTVPDIRALWRDDLVGFALGCSFTFEHALEAAGIAMRHTAMDATVPMFATTLETVPAGPFGGGMVVSMRPIREADVERTVEICRRYPHAHGAPVHAGDPAVIGIGDLAAPDWGDPVPVEAGEVPVFWACGVTPQNAVRRARLPLFIAHRPGSMLVTDVDERAEVPVLTD
jgi:uncharacterized protein YcsI (UPF0317 family)